MDYSQFYSMGTAPLEFTDLELSPWADPYTIQVGSSLTLETQIENYRGSLVYFHGVLVGFGLTPSEACDYLIAILIPHYLSQLSGMKNLVQFPFTMPANFVTNNVEMDAEYNVIRYYIKTAGVSTAPSFGDGLYSDIDAIWGKSGDTSSGDGTCTKIPSTTVYTSYKDSNGDMVFENDDIIYSLESQGGGFVYEPIFLGGGVAFCTKTIDAPSSNMCGSVEVEDPTVDLVSVYKVISINEEKITDYWMSALPCSGGSVRKPPQFGFVFPFADDEREPSTENTSIPPTETPIWFANHARLMPAFKGK